ncbi:MAG TPA: hypothetical protein VFS60_06000 [Thermoanaerobaculia bacterium]|nr:hypothetical protein [Thermoanaerobaculia bacterium]
MSVARRAPRLALALTAAFLGALALAPAAAVAAAAPPAPTAACPCLPKPVLPVALSAMESSWGWALTFITPPCPPVVELRVGVDGRKPVSLGREETKDPLTHRRAAQHQFIFAREDLAGSKGDPDGDHVLAVEIVRPGGRVDGPYKLLLSPREERLAAAKLQLARSPRTYVSFAEHGSVYTWLGFHSLFGMRNSLREVRYSVNDCLLGHRLVFPKDGGEPIADRGDEPTDLTFDRPFLTLLRETTRSACVQVVFADGTVSDVLELRRDAKAPPR